MLLSLDGTLVVQLINFLVFLIVLNTIFLKPVGAAIAKRRAYIDGIKREIDQYDSDVKALHKQAEERRAAARRDADAVIAQARAQGQARAAEIAAAYGAQAATLVAEAHAQVEHEVAEARGRADHIVDGLADQLLAQAIGTAA